MLTQRSEQSRCFEFGDSCRRRNLLRRRRPALMGEQSQEHCQHRCGGSAELLVSTYELGHQPFGLAEPAAMLRERGAVVRTVDLAGPRGQRQDVRRYPQARTRCGAQSMVPDQGGRNGAAG